MPMKVVVLSATEKLRCKSVQKGQRRVFFLHDNSKVLASFIFWLVLVISNNINID